MKKLFFTALIIFISTLGYSQITEVSTTKTEEVERITTVRDMSVFKAGLRKLGEDGYYINFRNTEYSYITDIQSLDIGDLETLKDFKGILSSCFEKKQTKRFVIGEKDIPVEVSQTGKYRMKYIRIRSASRGGVTVYDWGMWTKKKIEKLIPEELFKDL